MLKRTANNDPPPEPDRPVGELVHQLVEDGKAYAKAELAVVTAIASAKAKAMALPAALFGVALLIAQAAVTVLAVASFAMLQWWLGTVFAGIVAFLLFGALAAGVAWYAVQRVRREL